MQLTLYDPGGGGLGFLPNFATVYFEIAVKWSESQIFEKYYNWNMCQTLSKMHMHDMMTIVTIVQ